MYECKYIYVLVHPPKLRREDFEFHLREFEANRTSTGTKRTRCK